MSQQTILQDPNLVPVAQKVADYEYTCILERDVQTLLTMIAAGQYKAVPTQDYMIKYNTECLIYGNNQAYKNYMQYYWTYPALATAERVASDVTSAIQIIRQGIVMQSNESNISFYIGGCSKYWRSGNFVAFQTGKTIGLFGHRVTKTHIQVAGGAKLYGEQLDRYFSSMTEGEMEICVIPMISAPVGWINPQLYVYPPNSYLQSLEQLRFLHQVPVENLNYQPEINRIAITLGINAVYTSGGHTIISYGIPDSLRPLSNTFPFPYPAVLEVGGYMPLNYPYQLFVGLMYLVATEASALSIYSENLLYPAGYNDYKSRPFAINSASIGSPVYTSAYDPNVKSQPPCSGYKLLGLVSGIRNFYAKIGGSVSSDRSLLSNYYPKEFDIGLYYLPVIRVPENNNVDTILDYAKALRQYDAVIYGLNRVRSAKRAMESLIASGVISAIAFLSVLAVEDWVSEEQILSGAKPYVDKLNKAYSDALSFAISCINAQVNLPQPAKTMYVLEVQNYLQGLMYQVDPYSDESDIEGFLIGQIEEYLESQGIYC